MKKIWMLLAMGSLAVQAVELKNGMAYALADVPEELTVQLKRGGSVRFLLEENASTGYQWEATYATNECTVVIEHRGTNVAKGFCGAPGKAAFTVMKNAAVQSPSLVEFAYRRHWEKQTPAKRVRLVLYTIPGEAVDYRYPASRTLNMLLAECRNRGIELVDWHVHIRGGLTPEMAAEREKACGIRQSAMENHGREWEIFDNARLVAFADKARSAKVNGHTLPVGIQVNDRDWFRQIDAETRAKFDYILADTMIMGKLPNGRDRRLWLVKDIAEIGDPEKWMDEYVAMNLQILSEPISILANPGYLPAPLDGLHDKLWTEERMRKVIAKAVERGIAIEIQAESPYPSVRFLKLAKAMGAKFSFGTNNYDAAPKDLSRWLEAIVWLDLKREDIWTPSCLHAARPQIFGRDYWTWLTAARYSDPSVAPDATYNANIAQRAVFRDCALHCAVGGKPPQGKPAFRTVKDNYTHNAAAWERIEARGKPDKPLIVRWATKRQIEALAGDIDIDHDDFKVWRQRHPEVWGYECLDEWDNDMISIPRRIANVKDAETKRRLVAAWGDRPPTNRYEYLARAHKFFEREVALNYGQSNEIVAVRASAAMDHIAAAWGAKNLWVEMTNTTPGDREYRWDIAPMFTRGAARQFGLPWCWFQAVYMNGYTHDGREMNNSTCWEEPVPAAYRPASSPEGGLSASLERRGWYWAYLNGANGVEPEMWTTRFLLKKGTPDGREALSPRGVAFADFHDFTVAHPDRGTTFAPVAILTPFAAPYSASGGAPWGYCPYERGDEMMDGAFFALIAGHRRGEGMKRGCEYNLHNSPFAMMYDVLVPDAPQPAAALLKALSSYRVAVLTGAYREYGAFKGVLRAYVQAGGTLVVNAAQLKAGALSDDVTGVRVVDEVANYADKAHDESGRTFALDGTYAVQKLTLASARPLVTGEDGRVLMTCATFGKGRVIVTAPLWMAPLAATPREACAQALNGTRTFPFYRYLFARFQDELFPVRVSGDALYGINRTEKGWWLWCFNNKGVTKFTDTRETIDASAQSAVTVDLMRIEATHVRELVSGRTIPLQGRSFGATIPAGDFAVFALEK